MSVAAGEEAGVCPTPARRIGMPAPLEPHTLTHPDVPAAIDGWRVLHVSDLHIRRPWPRRLSPEDPRRQLLDAIASAEVDLAILTGDVIDKLGQERAGIDVLADILAAGRPRLGWYGVFGNHDTAGFRGLAKGLRAIRWLDNELVAPESMPGVQILGLSFPEDAVAALLGHPTWRERFTLTLAHTPTALLSAATIGLPLVFAGHTHGGQIRLHPRLAPHTSSDFPPHLASGVLRARSTLCCLSRGAGEGFLEGLRINCPVQVPLYTLRRGPLPQEGRACDSPAQVLPW